MAADTRDIINAIARALPVAVAQVRNEGAKNGTGDPVADARKITQYTRRRFQYQKDGLQYQDIRLPSALEATKKGDCKSLSLYIAAHLTALGYNNGLRFAAYGTDQPTHVYNWVLDNSGQIHTFDACTPDLKEVNRYTKIQDMQTRIIAGVPMLSEYYELSGPGRERRKARREERRAQGKGFGQRAKKIALAPARAPFLVLTGSNFRGLATKLAKVSPDKLAGFWGKLGGDKKKLEAAINQGKGKKPLLGMNGPDEIGSVAVAIAAAAPVVVAAVKMLKDAGIDGSDILAAVKKEAPDVEPLGDFEATDPETPEAEKLTKKKPGPEVQSASFQVDPLLIVGGLAALYILTRKKGRK